MKLGGHCDYTSNTPYRFIQTQAGLWTSSLVDDTTAYTLFFGGKSLGCLNMKGGFKLDFFVRCIKE